MWLLGLALGAVALSGCGTYTGGETLEANADPNAMECRNLLVPGSNVDRRYCATRAEWATYDDERRSNTQEALRRFLQRAGTTTGGNPNPLAP
jgi:hypothetical protein